MNYKTAVGYGLGIWLFVFAVAFMSFQVRASERALFESIMAVALTLAITCASARYFKSVPDTFFSTGWRVGLIWLAVNVLLDALVFSWGPMKMGLAEYVKDIGLSYLLMVIIPAGLGYTLERRGKS